MINVKRDIRALFVYPLLVIAGYAWAGDPVALNITGNIVASPCEINSEALNKTVDLGGGQPIMSWVLSDAGSATPWVPFELGVENCPASTTKTTIEFHGTADASNPADMYKNTGTAQGVAVQLQGAAGEPFGDGKTFTGIIVNSAYTYHLRVRAYSPNGGATSGTINAVVTTTFTYQ